MARVTLGPILTLLCKSTATWIPAFAGMTTLTSEATNGTVLGLVDVRQQAVQFALHYVVTLAGAHRPLRPVPLHDVTAALS